MLMTIKKSEQIQKKNLRQFDKKDIKLLKLTKNVKQMKE